MDVGHGRGVLKLHAKQPKYYDGHGRSPRQLRKCHSRQIMLADGGGVRRPADFRVMVVTRWYPAKWAGLIDAAGRVPEMPPAMVSVFLCRKFGVVAAATTKLVAQRPVAAGVAVGGRQTRSISRCEAPCHRHVFLCGSKWPSVSGAWNASKWQPCGCSVVAAGTVATPT